MFASILTPLVVVVPLLQPPTTQCRFESFGDPAREQQVLTMFADAVDNYAALHRRLARPMPVRWLTADPEQIEMATLELADTIRSARPNARPGDVFTAEVAHIFRGRIREYFRIHNYTPAVVPDEDGGEEGEDALEPVIVNEPLRWGAAHFGWPSMLAVLPLLPPELEYRFVDRRLVLVDVDANLVIDVLELALPAW